MSYLGLNAPNSISVAALPQTPLPLGKLTAFSCDFSGPTSNWREGKWRKKWEWWRGDEWRGIRHCLYVLSPSTAESDRRLCITLSLGAYWPINEWLKRLSKNKAPIANLKWKENVYYIMLKPWQLSEITFKAAIIIVINIHNIFPSCADYDESYHLYVLSPSTAESDRRLCITLSLGAYWPINESKLFYKMVLYSVL